VRALHLIYKASWALPGVLIEKAQRRTLVPTETRVKINDVYGIDMKPQWILKVKMDLREVLPRLMLTIYRTGG
jgi:hypothetical protein